MNRLTKKQIRQSFPTILSMISDLGMALLPANPRDISVTIQDITSKFSPVEFEKMVDNCSQSGLNIDSDCYALRTIRREYDKTHVKNRMNPFYVFC